MGKQKQERSTRQLTQTARGSSDNTVKQPDVYSQKEEAGLLDQYRDGIRTRATVKPGDGLRRMNAEDPDFGHERQSYQPDPGLFYTREQSWSFAPQTPPAQTAHLPDGNTFGSIGGSRHQETVQSFASDRPASQLTVVPQAPTPPSAPTEAEFSASGTSEDIDGPDRVFGPPLSSRHNDPGAHFARLRNPAHSLAGHDIGNPALGALFGQSMTTSHVMENAEHNTGRGASTRNSAFVDPGQIFKDALARDAANVTPGVDDTPYILYALDALTGNVTTSTSGALDIQSDNAHGSFPYRYIPDEGLGYYRHINIGTASIKLPAAPSPVHPGRDRRYPATLRNSPPEDDQPPLFRLPEITDARDSRLSTNSSVPTLVHSEPQLPRTSIPAHQLKDAWVYLDLKNFSPQARLVFPPPNFKPTILRPISMAVLMSLCILMTAGLVLSAVYSSKHHGLVVYDGGIYGTQFFVFRVLPQLLSVVILLYAQSVTLAVLRIRPFSRMEGFEHAHPEERNGAIFDDLYPRSFLLPQISNVGSWQIWVPNLVVWFMNFTVPLQSTLFSVVLVDENFRWATVLSVAWTLVGLYLCLSITAAFIMLYWYQRPTGLIWDPRSIADFIVLASNCNKIADYRGSELLATRQELRDAVHGRSIDKIGYWTWRDGRTNGVWHGIGTDMLDDAWFDLQVVGGGGRKKEKASPLWTEKRRKHESGAAAGVDLEELALSPHSERVRYRYLPWCMRTNQLLGYVVSGFLLLLALFIISFLPSTSIQYGFLPRIDAATTAGAFSAANFLYSFLPALLGQVLFLLFSDLELSLRILQPWAELAKHAGGAQPETSILADYAACLPLQCTWHALRNRHWRVAALSLMSTVFAFVPALAGGLFMAMTMSPGGVRMVPNMALYAVVLALLVLYLACLVSMLPGRQTFRLPHAVTCIAEIFSFCANEDLMREPAFKHAYNRAVLLSQLGIGPLAADASRWIFTTGTSGDERRLGIHRVRRYTELTNRPSGRRPPQVVTR